MFGFPACINVPKMAVLTACMAPCLLGRILFQPQHCYSPSAFPHPLEPGAALQIDAGAAPLVAALPSTDPDGAVGRATSVPASSAAGIGGHPVRGAVYCRPIDGLSAGHNAVRT